jgi:hypothetical protein
MKSYSSSQKVVWEIKNEGFDDSFVNAIEWFFDFITRWRWK